jgi:hypothetical protein
LSGPPHPPLSTRFKKYAPVVLGPNVSSVKSASANRRPTCSRQSSAAISSWNMSGHTDLPPSTLRCTPVIPIPGSLSPHSLADKPTLVPDPALILLNDIVDGQLIFLSIAPAISTHTDHTLLLDMPLNKGDTMPTGQPSNRTSTTQESHVCPDTLPQTRAGPPRSQYPVYTGTPHLFLRSCLHMAVCEIPSSHCTLCRCDSAHVTSPVVTSPRPHSAHHAPSHLHPKSTWVAVTS